jgi:hypothetical protein
MTRSTMSGGASTVRAPVSQSPTGQSEMPRIAEEAVRQLEELGDELRGNGRTTTLQTSANRGSLSLRAGP